MLEWKCLTILGLTILGLTTLGLATLDKLMSYSKLSALLISMLLLTSCTQYGPRKEIGGFDTGGYQDTRINENTIIVSYSANLFTQASLVRPYLLYRAAMVTINNGYDYFIITAISNCRFNTQVKEKRRYYPVDPVNFYNEEYSKVEFQSAKTTLSKAYFDICTRNARSAVATIKMFKGQKPAGVSTAYEATDVIAHFGAAAN